MEAFDDFGNFDSATPQPNSFASNNTGFAQPKASGTEDDWTEEEQALMAQVAETNAQRK